MGFDSLPKMSNFNFTNTIIVKHAYFLLVTVILIANSPAKAQVSPDFKQQIAGSWEGEGTLLGQAATFSMKWESTLGGQFLSLEFINRFKDSSGMERAMEARAYYNLRTNRGYWFDSRRGNITPAF